MISSIRSAARFQDFWSGLNFNAPQVFTHNLTLSTQIKKGMLRIGDTAPNFTAHTSIGEIDFHEFGKDSWVLFCSHPADFTPVCTTELGALANLDEELKKRNTKAIAISCDDAESHKTWIKDINDTQSCTVLYPIIADQDRKIANLYGMLPANSEGVKAPVTVRTVYFLDPQHKVRAMIVYPPSTGRNFHEILRVLDSMQVGDKYKVVTPANWNKGEKVMIPPSISNEDATKLFPNGFETVRPYMRLTEDPSK